MARRPEMGKWLLYRFFHKNARIAPYLPATRKFTADAFQEMLSKYPQVYIKPVAGSMGRGIMKAWKNGNKIVVKHTTKQTHTFANVSAAKKYIDSMRNGKMYIVQKGIELAKVDGRVFDIRIMMQREKPGGGWRYSGMCAKVAGPKSVVTNAALSRGTVIDVEQALASSLGWKSDKIKKTVNKLSKLGLEWAKHFDSYQQYRELGFDVAIDTKGRIWLIEQNTLPSHNLFKKNKSNLAPYRRIQYRWGVYERARKGQKKGKKRA